METGLEQEKAQLFFSCIIRLFLFPCLLFFLPSEPCHATGGTKKNSYHYSLSNPPPHYKEIEGGFISPSQVPEERAREAAKLSTSGQSLSLFSPRWFRSDSMRSRRTSCSSDTLSPMQSPLGQTPIYQYVPDDPFDNSQPASQEESFYAQLLPVTEDENSQSSTTSSGSSDTSSSSNDEDSTEQTPQDSAGQFHYAETSLDNVFFQNSYVQPQPLSHLVPDLNQGSKNIRKASKARRLSSSGDSDYEPSLIQQSSNPTQIKSLIVSLPHPGPLKISIPYNVKTGQAVSKANKPEKQTRPTPKAHPKPRQHPSSPPPLFHISEQERQQIQQAQKGARTQSQTEHPSEPREDIASYNHSRGPKKTRKQLVEKENLSRRLTHLMQGSDTRKSTPSNAILEGGYRTDGRLADLLNRSNVPVPKAVLYVKNQSEKGSKIDDKKVKHLISSSIASSETNKWEANLIRLTLDLYDIQDPRPSIQHQRKYIDLIERANRDETVLKSLIKKFLTEKKQGHCNNFAYAADRLKGRVWVPESVKDKAGIKEITNQWDPSIVALAVRVYGLQNLVKQKSARKDHLVTLMRSGGINDPRRIKAIAQYLEKSLEDMMQRDVTGIYTALAGRLRPLKN